MTAENFQPSLVALLKDEGFNDDDPQDHGGRTSRGITQREYDAFRIVSHAPPGDVWNATTEEITAIYHDYYWEPWCDKFPVGLDYLFFDMAVNAGPHRATLLLQRVLGVEQDGHIGPITLSKLVGGDAGSLVARYSDAKRSFYRSLNQPRFIRGWLNRVNHVASIATAMLPTTQGVTT
jgi:lysozyme family protein